MSVYRVKVRMIVEREIEVEASSIEQAERFVLHQASNGGISFDILDHLPVYEVPKIESVTTETT